MYFQAIPGRLFEQFGSNWIRTISDNGNCRLRFRIAHGFGSRAVSQARGKSFYSLLGLTHIELKQNIAKLAC